jgi:beta-1,4-mannosyl-glycoprotein beta-1,4-N-acetylglucosaminyltransferase
MTRKVYDCFTFFNELDILEIRLEEMSEVVDRFVLVEATQTFQGKSKPLYFNENRNRFSKWLHKIEHIIIDFPEVFPKTLHKEPGWEREEYQRNAISQGLIHAQPNDLIILSDVDEVIKADILKKVVKNSIYDNSIVMFIMPIFNFYLNLLEHNNWDICPKMIEMKNLKGFQKLRMIKFFNNKKSDPVGINHIKSRIRNFHRTGMYQKIKILRDSGWHFSSAGGYDNYVNKLQSYSHLEAQHIITTKAYTSFINKMTEEPLEKMPIYVQNNVDKFTKLLKLNEKVYSGG